jgi:predicted PurR-regulated permease PerM
LNEPATLPDTSPPAGPGSTRRRVVFLSICAVAFFAIVLAFHTVLVPFVLAVLLAYLLAPVVARLERVRFGARSMPRWVAVVVIYVVLLGVLSGATAVAVPRLSAELTRLANEAPQIAERVRVELLPRLESMLRSATASYRPTRPAAAELAVPGPASIRVVPADGGGYEILLPERGIDVTPQGEGVWRVTPAEPAIAGDDDLSAQLEATIERVLSEGGAHAATVFATAQTLVRGVFRGIFVASMTLMISAYLLITSDAILGFFRGLVRVENRGRFDELLRRIDRGLGGVVRGQLMICVVNGVLSGIGFYIAGLAYWPVLALIATVLSIIPIFGAFLSSVPAIAIGLQQGVGVAVFVLAWIVGIHQIEANLLNPKIMGDAARVHPVLVIFSLLAGEHAFGFMGALLAVPVLSIVQSLFLHFRAVAFGDAADAATTAPEGAPRVTPEASSPPA